jgi:hypothetical protein
MTAIDRICPDARRLLLIPENHTRNLFYLQNVAQLAAILRLTGLEVRLGSLVPEIDRPTPVALPDGSSLLLEPLLRSRDRLGLKDFDPCARSCSTTIFRPAFRPSCRTSTSSSSCRRCTPAGRCAASRTTLQPTTRWRKFCPGWSASTRGGSTPTFRSATASTSTSARARNAWPPMSTPCSV